MEASLGGNIDMYNVIRYSEASSVRDEYDPDWELGGMHQTIQYALLLIQHLNESRIAPQWKDNLPFPIERADEEMK